MVIPYKRYASRTQVTIHSVTLLVKEDTSTVMSYDLPSLKDAPQEVILVLPKRIIQSNQDGYEWGEWTDVTMTSGTNLAPELRSVTDGSVIGGTLNTTIRTNERRALSEYISYYDDPNDD